MYKILKQKFVDASLRQKIVLMISLLATITPTVLISMLAYAYFTLGIESLFNEKISRSIENTVQIAESYMEEHKSNIRSDVLAISNNIKLNANILLEDHSQFNALLDKQAELRKLDEVYVFKPDTGMVVAKNSFLFSLLFEKRIPDEAIKKAKEGDVVILDGQNNEKVRAIVKIGDEFPGTYLLIGKTVDPFILDHLRNTQGSANQYQALIGEINATKAKLELIFIASSALLSLLAIILGMRLAHHITKPINRLVEATERIKIGDYSVKLPEKQGRDEIAILTRAFNKMIAKISNQREELIKFNSIVDERRRFIEAVMAELSSGVIALDKKHKITLYNNSAAKLLKIRFAKKPPDIGKIFPEVIPYVERAKMVREADIHQNLEINRKGQKRQFFVRIYAQIGLNNDIEFIIITFDDITELVSAQRTAAWSDVARRIAHEIKNPLTPIHLAAERLKKKYLGQITSDADSFNKYIDTIIRHVGDIGKMAEEFALFARIPAPIFKKDDLVKIIKDAMFAQEYTYKEIHYTFDSQVTRCIMYCDTSQISQVLVNILKNAAESIKTKQEKAEKSFEGKIKVGLNVSEQFAEISVTDNGVGFPNDLLDRIFEPYITTKSQGTGLGLSIVKKIIEDHGGSIKIESSDHGAIIKFILKLNNERKNVES